MLVINGGTPLPFFSGLACHNKGHPRDGVLRLLSCICPQINQRARRAAVPDMVLNSIQVVSFLPKQHADGMFEDMVVRL